MVCSCCPSLRMSVSPAAGKTVMIAVPAATACVGVAVKSSLTSFRMGVTASPLPSSTASMLLPAWVPTREEVGSKMAKASTVPALTVKEPG